MKQPDLLSWFFTAVMLSIIVAVLLWRAMRHM